MKSLKTRWIVVAVALLVFCCVSRLALATTVYENDFSVEAGPEWSSQSIDVTPLGNRAFLGQFTNETVTLSLEDLPTHASVTLAFDLFIIRTWDGNNDPADQWELSINDDVTLLNTTFSAFFNSWDRQAYPGSYPGGDFPAHTGASEVGTLGYQYPGLGGYLDSVYELSFTFPDSSSSLALNFRGIGLDAPSDESWGITNVIVTANPVPEPSALALISAAGASLLFRGRRRGVRRRK